jgi:uridine kinase
MRLERSIIARQTALGAHRCDKDEALVRLASAAGPRPAATPAV